ncbi:hypothetical protein FH972_011711 [Carpinus fangiana]|uniref:SelT-like protein n=1 Tax=Carpinus fangiana TaxID=176857 RepID=A0A660KS44_9ROSI|nr:hypothetical protein FH972_011711 [Carpinus fangiana]
MWAIGGELHETNLANAGDTWGGCYSKGMASGAKKVTTIVHGCNDVGVASGVVEAVTKDSGCCSVGVDMGAEFVTNKDENHVLLDSGMSNFSGPIQDDGVVVPIMEDGLDSTKYVESIPGVGVALKNPSAVGKTRGSTLRGWKRQAHSSTTVAPTSVLVRTSRRKRSDGSSGGQSKKVKKYDEHLIVTSGVGGIGLGNTVNINFCASCSYRGTAVTMKKMLDTVFPGIDVVLANYPPSLPKRLLAKVVPFFQMGAVAIVVAGEHIFPMLGVMAPPAWYYSLRANKFGTIATFWLLGNAAQSFLQSSGAFEVYLNDELVFSKLNEGRFPGEIELKDLIGKRLTTTGIVDGLGNLWS